MKTILITVLVCLATTALVEAEEVLLARETRLTLAKGSVVLPAGKRVDVISIDGDVANVSLGSLKGQIPVSALREQPKSIQAAADVAPAAASSPIAETAAHGPRSEPFDAEVAAAGKELAAVLHQAEAKVIDGDVDAANDLLAEHFPEATRTDAQRFVLANLTFGLDPERSYALHKRVATTRPDDPSVQLEWAMEQHRAKQYAGALAAYRRHLQVQPENALAYGLAAECAIRLGDPRQAAVLWLKSERAKQGTLESLESFVCEINGGFHPDLARQGLLRKVRARNETAASELLLLDSNWRKDWWNAEPSRSRLQKDTALVRQLFASPGQRLRETECLADCLLLGDAASAAMKQQIIAKGGYVFDAQRTLPQDGRVLSPFLSVAAQSEQRAALRTTFGSRVRAQARERKDAEMYNAAAFLYLNTAELPTIDQEGWDVTHDPRFAVSRLVGMKDLRVDSPLVRRALAEFPNDSELTHLVVQLAAREKQPLEPFLIAGIKAEYTKLSSTRPGVDFPRPSAYVLRGYFLELARLEGLVENAQR